MHEAKVTRYLTETSYSTALKDISSHLSRKVILVPGMPYLEDIRSWQWKPFFKFSHLITQDLKINIFVVKLWCYF